jgi:multiple sugar transport system permease protein
MSQGIRYRLTNGVILATYVVIIVFFLFPIFWVFSLSLRTIPELFASPPIWFPKDPQFQNYIFVLRKTPVGQYLIHSLILVVLTVLVVLAIAVPAAYALSRFQFRLSRATLVAILVCQMISPVVIVIPLYNFFASLNVLNNYVTLLLVYSAISLPFSTWFLRGYFNTIPRDLDEAAHVDGCSRLQALWHVILPMTLPGITSAALLVAVLSWSQFVVPFILVDDPNFYPVTVGLVNLEGNSDAITLQYLAAGSILAIVPVMLIFVLLQRFIVSGLTNGAVKG